MSEPHHGYSDDQRHAALAEGAAAIRTTLARLSSSWGEDVRQRMVELRDHAEVLEAMVKRYE